MADHSSTLRFLLLACLFTMGFSSATHRCHDTYSPHTVRMHADDPHPFLMYFGGGPYNGYLPMESTTTYGTIYRRNMTCLSTFSAGPNECMYGEVLSVRTQGTFGHCNFHSHNNDVVLASVTMASLPQVFQFCGYGSSSSNWGSMHFFNDAGQSLQISFSSNNQVPNAIAERGFAGYVYAYPCAGSSRRRRAAEVRFTGDEDNFERNKNRASSKTDSVDVDKELQRRMSPEDYENVKMIREQKVPQRHTAAYHALCDRSCHSRRLVDFHDCCHYWYNNRITPEPCNEPVWGPSGWHIPECPKELQLPRPHQSSTIAVNEGKKYGDEL